MDTPNTGAGPTSGAPSPEARDEVDVSALDAVLAQPGGRRRRSKSGSGSSSSSSSGSGGGSSGSGGGSSRSGGGSSRSRRSGSSRSARPKPTLAERRTALVGYLTGRSARPDADELGAPVAGRSRSRRTTATERRLVTAIAALAGLLGATSDAHPTGLAGPDVLLCFGFAFVVTLAAARGRRSTWLVLGAAGAILGPHGLWQVLGLLGLAVALASTFLDRRRLMGAVVGLLTVPAMMHAHPFGFTGASALCVWAAVTPALVSGYRVASRRSQERMQRAAQVVFLVALGGTLIFGLAVWISWASLQRGGTDAQQGLEALRAGHGSEASVLLGDSADSLGDAHDVLGAWWTAPARLVPLVAQQAEALSTLTGQGQAIAQSGATAASKADYQQLRYQKGQVDLDRMRALQGPLDAAAATLDHAQDQFAQVKSPWLVGPVSTALNQVSDEVDRTVPQAELAAQGAQVAPALLGGDGTRHYFIAFTTPAEERGLGGFMGNWAELTATDGKLTLSRSGRTSELAGGPNSAAAKARTITGPADYVARYGIFKPATYFQDVTMSPDLPSVADVIGQLYPQMGGDQIDGVFVVDPYGLAALLNFTGPIQIDGSPEALTADNAADLLVRRQYLEFPDKDARLDFLDQATKKTFESLTAGDIPGPEKLASVLAPAFLDRHLMFSAVRPDEQALFDRLGATGSFPAASPDRDFFALTSQNTGNNKIDVFLRREVSYDVAYDPSTGQEHATATIALHNDAPASGLPGYVIGDNKNPSTPDGTNEMYLSFYSPFDLSSSVIDGNAVPFNAQREFGYRVYSRYVSVPPGGTVTVVLDLAGRLTGGTDYRLGVAVQPMVTPDSLHVVVTPSPGWEVAEADTLRPDIDRQRASFLAQPGHPVQASAQFRPG